MASAHAGKVGRKLASVPEVPAGGDADDGAGRQSSPTPAGDTAVMEQGRNEVRLRGRLGVGSRELTLPSGDTVVSFHLVVPRPPRSARSQQRRPREPTVDTLACAAWTSRCRRTVSTATAGDLLEVEGALRRRFRRAAGAPVSFYEVEVTAVRRVRASAG